MESAVKLALMALALSASLAGQACSPGYWDATPGNNHQTLKMIDFDDGGGRTLFAATTVGILKWNGSQWISIGTFSGVGLFTLGYVSFAVFDDGLGGGPALYVGGSFTSIGGVPASNLARWTGFTWAPVVWGAAQGAGVPMAVAAMAVFNGALYLAGNGEAPYTSPGPHGLFRWNGYSMTNLLSPAYTCGSSPCKFLDALVLDDGTGPALYLVGPGAYAPAGSTNWTWSAISKWDGAALTPVATTADDVIWSLASFHDGTAERLCAGGNFTTIDGVLVNAVAMRVGGSWTPLANGLLGSGSGAASVRGMRSYNDGTGNRLHVAGSFLGAPGVASAGIIAWDGSQWQGYGSGLVGGFFPYGTGCCAYGFTDATCSAVYVGGYFTGVPGVASACIIRHRSPAPTVSFDQTATGAPVTIDHASLVPGHDYHSVFSFEGCAGGVGTGPYAGLCTTNPAFLHAQIATFPLGTDPFYFTALTTSKSFGPYPLAPGTPFDAGAIVQGLTFDFTNGSVGCVSSVGARQIQ